MGEHLTPVAWRFQKEPLSDDPYELCDDADGAATYIGPLYSATQLTSVRAAGAEEERKRIVEWLR